MPGPVSERWKPESPSALQENQKESKIGLKEKKEKKTQQKKKSKKMIREKEDNCVTRQEVLVENLNEFKGQSKVELFSEKINLIFLLSAVCVPVSNSVSVSIFCHFFFLLCSFSAR